MPENEPLLTNIRSSAENAEGDVYFINQGEPDIRDKKYKYTYYEKPPGSKPSDDDLDFWQKRKDFLSRAKQEIGYDPDTLNPDKDADYYARKTMKENNPLIAIFGVQNNEDRRVYQDLYKKFYAQSQAKKTYGNSLIKDLTTMFRSDYLENKRHARTLAEQEAKLPTSESELIKTSMYDPNPEKRKQAQGILDAIKQRKIEEMKQKESLKEPKISDVDKSKISAIDNDLTRLSTQLGRVAFSEDRARINNTIAKLKLQRDAILNKYNQVEPQATKKLLGTKNGKNVYDLGNGQWQIGD